jgi:hypothetical protein
MSEDQNFRCINNLPQKPNTEELTAKRKGLRKMKLPVFTTSEYGSCPQLGFYKVIFDKQAYFEWQVIGKEMKQASFIDLCSHSDLELDRLDLGWLIADLYSLQKNIEIKQISGPNETMSMLSWYAKLEDPWRRWALVPAGHMLFK